MNGAGGKRSTGSSGSIREETLGYLWMDDERGVFRGAVLLTDFRGIPKDFRYSDPITPSRIERVLYGGALEVYLREEIILTSLLGALEVKPGLWLCSARELMRPLRALGNLPTALLQESTREPLDFAGEIRPLGEETSFVVQLSELAAPVRLEVVREDLPKVGDIVAFLGRAAETMDVREPFGRIAKALQTLDEEARA